MEYTSEKNEPFKSKSIAWNQGTILWAQALTVEDVIDEIDPKDIGDMREGWQYMEDHYEAHVKLQNQPFISTN